MTDDDEFSTPILIYPTQSDRDFVSAITSHPSIKEISLTDKTIIRTSERKDFKLCREKHNFAWNMNLEPVKPSIFYRFGTGIHKGWEIYYNPLTWHIPRAEILPMAIRAFQESFVFPGDIDNASEDEREEFYRHLELGKGMLTGYAEWAPQHDKFTPLATELKFEVPIPGLYGTFYQGKIDLLVQDEQGGYWIVDHKTAASLDAQLADFLPMDEQVGSYVWALQHELGIKIEGFIYNEAVKNVPHPPNVNKNGALSQDKRQNTTYKLYVEALRREQLAVEPYVEFLAYLKDQPNKFFRRTVVHMSPRQLAIIGDRIAQEARDMQTAVIYPNPTLYGCKVCAFKSPCMAKQDGSDFQWILDELYREREE